MKDNKEILNDMKPLTDEELTNVCGGALTEVIEQEDFEEGGKYDDKCDLTVKSTKKIKKEHLVRFNF